MWSCHVSFSSSIELPFRTEWFNELIRCAGPAFVAALLNLIGLVRSLQSYGGPGRPLRAHLEGQLREAVVPLLARPFEAIQRLERRSGSSIDLFGGNAVLFADT